MSKPTLCNTMPIYVLLFLPNQRAVLLITNKSTFRFLNDFSTFLPRKTIGKPIIFPRIEQAYSTRPKLVIYQK